MRMYRYFGTLKLIIILWTLICLQDAQAIRKLFEVVKRCPFNESEWKVRAAHTACNGSESYHCLLTEGGVSMREQCTDASLFTSGFCPIFTNEGYLQWSACKDTACPTSSYRSDEVYQYQICYQKTDNLKEKNTEKGSNDSSSVPGVTIIIVANLLAFVLVSVLVFYRRNQCGFKDKVQQCIFVPRTHIQHRNDTEGHEAYPVENNELSDIVRNEDTVEQESFLWIETEDSLESPPTIKHEGENISGARKSGNSDSNDAADMKESDNLLEHFHDAPSCSLTNIKQKNSEVSTDVQRKKMDEEKSAENASGLCIVSEISYNEDGDTQELTDVFDDTVGSVQRIPPQTDEQGELCSELYNLLGLEGRKLTQEVMAATISRETGKPVKILLNNLSVQENTKLKGFHTIYRFQSINSDLLF